MIYVKNFEKNKVSKIKLKDFGTKIVPYKSMNSVWYKECLDILDENINPELFILCPIYTDEKGNKDYQIGITGTFDTKDRSMVNALRRECREELGIDIHLSGPKDSSCVKFKIQKKYNILLCIASILDFEFLPPRAEPDYDPNEHPVFRKKVVCFPVGEEEELLEYLSTNVGRESNLTEHMYLKEVAAVPIYYFFDQNY